MSTKGKVSVIYLIIIVVIAAGAGAMVWRELRLTKEKEGGAAAVSSQPAGKEAPPPPTVQSQARTFEVKSANREGFKGLEVGGPADSAGGAGGKEIQLFIMPSAVVRKHGLAEIGAGAVIVAKKYLVFGNGTGILEADVYQSLSARSAGE